MIRMHARILRACFTFGKRRVESVAKFCRDMEMLALPLPTSTRQFRRVKNHIPMSQDISLKACRKAVNQALYSPTAERKANALKLLKQLTESVASLVEIKPKAKKKPKAKPSKRAIAEAKVKPSKKVDLAKLTKAELLAMLSA